MTVVACLLVLGKDTGISQVISLSLCLHPPPSPQRRFLSVSLLILPLPKTFFFFQCGLETFRVSPDPRVRAVTQRLIIS